MGLPDFELERYMARWEFRAEHLLCSSDVQGWRMDELLELADPECRRLWSELTLGYTESAGHPLLRAEIAGLYGLEPEDVLTFAGAEEAIFAAMHVLVEPEDHVLATWPSYQSLHEVARSRGAEVTRLELDAERDWELAPLSLRGNTRLVIVNFPHNPTGALPEAGRFQEILDCGVRVFSDEVYRGLEYGPALPPAARVSPTALSLGVMSKAFGMAGLRIGWLACQDRQVLTRMAAFKDYTTICNSAPSEILALIALRNRDRVLERNRALVGANLERLDAFMERHRSRLEWVRPRAGCIGFLRLLDQDVDKFCQELLKQESTLLLPGRLFGHPGNHFRIGYGRSDFGAGLERLERFLK